MEKMNTVQPLFPFLPERLAGLEELAENLWWSWNPGARMLFKTLGIDHYLLHLNEGHAAFALLERIRATVSAGKDFAAACEKNINTTIFTTHTPVPAGHDVFPFLFQKYGRGFERLAW